MSIVIQNPETSIPQKRPLPAFIRRLSGHATSIFVAGIFLLGIILAWACHISLPEVMETFSYNIIIILISMELFTDIVVQTNIMSFLAVRIVAFSRAKRRTCLLLFGITIFLISAFLNNITAVLMILPVVKVFLKSIDVDRQYIIGFFSLILVMSNLGGAATPIGDFPAVTIMQSNITSFAGYLTHAFPFCLLSAIAILIGFIWRQRAYKENEDLAILAVRNLQSQYKNLKVRKDLLLGILIIFIAMLTAWCILPQNVMPPALIAALGYIVAALYSSLRGMKVHPIVDLSFVIQIGGFLFVSQVVAEAGILNSLASILNAQISNPKLVLLTFMVIAALSSGIFSAGPAAAAMMPIIVQLCDGPLANQADWVAVAYAAAICAGSSLFMWSATAGFILSNKVSEFSIKSSIKEKSGNNTIKFGVFEYMRYGIACFLVQLAFALGLAVAVL